MPGISRAMHSAGIKQVLRDRELGHEVDLVVKKKISEYLEILSGYSFFIPGEFVKRVPSPTAQWAFLQTTVFF